MAGSPWTNQVVSLIILTEETTGFSGLFGYSPTAGAGNLIFSVAAAAGTDEYGNAYQDGITTYAGTTWGQLVDGILQFQGVAGQAVNTIIAQLGAAELDITSGSVSGGAQAEIFLYAADSTAGAGQAVATIQADLVDINASNILLTNAATGAIPVSAPSIGILPSNPNSGSLWVSGERAFMNNDWVASINSNFSSIVTQLQEAGIFA